MRNGDVNEMTEKWQRKRVSEMTEKWERGRVSELNENKNQRNKNIEERQRLEKDNNMLSRIDASLEKQSTICKEAPQAK